MVVTDKADLLISLVFHWSGFLTYTVCEEVMHSEFTPFAAYWLNHIPLDTILLSAEAFHTC